MQPEAVVSKGPKPFCNRNVDPSSRNRSFQPVLQSETKEPEFFDCLGPGVTLLLLYSHLGSSSDEVPALDPIRLSQAWDNLAKQNAQKHCMQTAQTDSLNPKRPRKARTSQGPCLLEVSVFCLPSFRPIQGIRLAAWSSTEKMLEACEIGNPAEAHARSEPHSPNPIAHN